MIDIVTVAFEEELPVLEVQAHSIDIYCQNLGVKNIYVIVNDSHAVADQIDPAWWGSFRDRVRIVPRSTYGCSFVENGWVSQQALKLLGATLSYNDYSMVLDAKTIVTDLVTPDTFIEPDERLCLRIHQVLPVFERSAEISGELFGITVSGVPEPNGVPFIFHNQTVRDLVDYVAQHTGQDFAEWFQAQGMLTEFVLYSAYIQFRHGSLDAVYTQSNRKGLSGNICHSQVAMFDQRLQWSKDLRPLTVGVHRRAWTQVTQDQRQDYVDFLTSIGVTKAEKLL